jgi:hypothetical protein
VVMPSCSPNMDWPIVPVRWQFRGQLAVPCGQVPMAETDARDLAVVLAQLAGDRGYLNESKARAFEWAEQHSWEALLPLYREELSRAVAVAGSRV